MGNLAKGASGGPRGGGMTSSQPSEAPSEMAFKPFDADAMIDAMAPVLRLEISDEHRPGVRLNLKTAGKMAALLEQVPIEDAAEPAPVYRP